MDEERRVTIAAGKVSTATFISRITGFLRDVVLAKIFGATGVTDAFFIAYRIPNFLRELFAEGSISAAFVPVFTEYLTKEGSEGAKRLAGVVFAFLLSVLMIVCLLGVILAPYIASAVAPGFIGQHEKFMLTVKLTRIMFPFLLFVSLAALAMGVLNSYRCFFIPAIAPAFFNLVIIVSVLFVAPKFSVPILAVGLGVTFGGALQYGIQAVALAKRHLSFKPIFLFTHPGLKRILLLVLPAVAGMGVNQINIFLNNIFVSYLPEGSATYLFYGLRLVHFPIGIFGVAMAMAVLPSLSAHATKGELNELRNTFSFSLRLLFFLTIPAMAGLIALAEPIVNLLFQRGQFTYEATRGTVIALWFYSSGLWAYVGVRIVVSTFYSMQDTKTPLRVGIFAVLTNIFFSIILMGPLKHGGLALANAIGSAVNFTVLFYLLRTRLGKIDGKKILRSFIKITAASIIIGVVGRLIIGREIWMESGDTLLKACILAGVIALCVIVYFFTMSLLRSEELRYLINMRKEKNT
jgi:putative peptidoglycan lipid II flippase